MLGQNSEQSECDEWDMLVHINLLNSSSLGSSLGLICFCSQQKKRLNQAKESRMLDHLPLKFTHTHYHSLPTFLNQKAKAPKWR